MGIAGRSGALYNVVFCGKGLCDDVLLLFDSFKKNFITHFKEAAVQEVQEVFGEG